MIDLAVPMLVALLVWWLGTGVVLLLDRLPSRTYSLSLLGSAAVLGASSVGLAVTREGTGTAHAYAAFCLAVALWGALELAYFLGPLSGPRKAPCPPECRGLKRFVLALGTSLYHELAVVGAAGLLALILWEQPNQVGLWTFGVLWIMRWSAKLNVFLGVPNLNDDWLPEHLCFLHSYMPKRPMNLLFPVSVTAGTTAVVLLALEALGPESSQFRSVGLTLVTTLLALAVLEHWLLVLPVSDASLWGWAYRGKDRPGHPGPRPPAARRLRANPKPIGMGDAVRAEGGA